MDTERILDQFDDAWARGAPRDIRQAVSTAANEIEDTDSLREVVYEMVAIDLWHRWRSGIASEAGRAEGSAATFVPHDTGLPSGTLPACPRLEDYAQRLDDFLRLETVPPELIAEEYRARRRWRERPTHEEYLQRFPNQAAELPAELSRIDSESPEAMTACDSLVAAPPDGHAPNPRRPEMLADEQPERIGRYHVVATLDSGGQGRVFRAVHPQLRQEVAIKLGHPVPTHAVDHRNLLVAEGRLLAQLDHPNLVRVHDLDFHQDRPFVVMDYVPGRSLHQIAAEGRMAPERAAEIIAKIARSLASAHARGITHGDLKPANILIDEQGEPRLIDFGLARHRSAYAQPPGPVSSLAGTLQFMSPEQAQGDENRIGCPSDVFGLGAVLYFLLVGKAPFAGESVQEVLGRVRNCDFETVALPSGGHAGKLSTICLKAMSAAPEDRFDSVEQMAAALEDWAYRRPRARTFLALFLGALVAAVVVAIVALTQWPGKDPARALLGRPPRVDFPLGVEFIGHSPTGDRISLIDGQSVTFRLVSPRECYVGIWHVDCEGAVTQLFPNDHDQDNLLLANRPLTIPSSNSYSVNVSAASGVEYIYAAASTQPWEALAGQELGPDVVFASQQEIEQWLDKVRGMSLVTGEGQYVAEVVLPIEVHPREAPDEL